MRLWIGIRGNSRQTKRASTVEEEHRRPIDECRVPSGRWRQCAEQESEEPATRGCRLETSTLETERRDAKDGKNTGLVNTGRGHWNVIPQS